MKTLLLVALMLVVLGGCLPEASTEPTKPGQAEAETLVWSQGYGESLAMLPSVRWHVDGEGGCVAGFRAADGQCELDLAVAPGGDWVIDVAWRGSFRKSEFAHGLCHAHALLRFPPFDGDPNHQGSCFLGALTARANESLAAVPL